MRCRFFTNVLFLAVAHLCSPSGWAKTGDEANRLSQYGSYAELKSDIGREPDLSEAGGACGGIVIHDWIAEKIRVISLGDIVESVTVLGADNE